MHYNIKYKSRGSEETYQYLRHFYGGNTYSLFDFQGVEQDRIIVGVWEK